jgi:hypothetical protein
VAKGSARTAGAIAALFVLLGGCRPSGRSDAEDGGPNLDRRQMSAAAEEGLRHQPCWRQERGGWHYSIVHCETMGAPETLSGVFIIAFEERSFIVGATALPDPSDPRRYANEIDLEPSIVFRFAGAEPKSPLGDAYALTFLGRRTRDPIFVDCQGQPSFGYVVDRLLTARHLGSEPRGAHIPTPAEIRSEPVRVRKIHGGVWGRLEDEAIVRCGHRNTRELGGRYDPPDNLTAPAPS